MWHDATDKPSIGAEYDGFTHSVAVLAETPSGYRVTIWQDCGSAFDLRGAWSPSGWFLAGTSLPVTVTRWQYITGDINAGTR